MTAEERAGDALEHLQKAMLEMIEAARSTLDLVEGVVADPQSLSAFLAQAGHLAQTVVAAASSAAPDGPAWDRGHESGSAPRPSSSGPAGGPPVQHIPVT